MALLFARSVPTSDPSVIDIHVVNLGNVSARAASWRVERTCSGPQRSGPTVHHLPNSLLPGCDLRVATMDRVRQDRGRVDIVVRWVQPGGVVDESLFTLAAIEDGALAGTAAAQAT
ncbi:MAG: hypothetical protein JWL72_2173 [Ilumatobacteraceae bacterium]|nr:hypothetical protein [Ilumatobacteraceae bacterium]